MGLADWIKNTSGGNAPVIAIDVTAPLVGSGGLSLEIAQASPVGAGNLYLASPFSKGFTKGRIRTLVRWDIGSNMAGTEDWCQAGIICMQSALDVSGTSGSCYTAGIGTDDISSATFRISLAKQTGGLSETGSANRTELFGAVAPGTAPPPANAFWPIELEWSVDIEGLGGTRLIFRVGDQNSTDFSTLVDQADILDTASPLTATVAEGVFIQKGNTIAPNNPRNFTLDETTVYELT